MSSSTLNLDKPLELIQKTYTLQTTNQLHENPSTARVSHAKISTHQPSRKSSVHDIHEVTRDDLNKILSDIQANLSRLKFLLETTVSVQTIRDEFFKLKDHLFMKILEFISKLSNESTRRGSITSRGNNSNTLIHHPQHLVYCIEHFRSELLKAKYLFNSLTNLSSIGTATLDNIQIKSISNSFYNQFQDENNRNDSQDSLQIKKDISILEDHAYVLSQQYYNHLPDWNNLDRTVTDEERINKTNGFHGNRLHGPQLKQKLSTASSIASMDDGNFCSRIYQKCQNICCLCTPNYI